MSMLPGALRAEHAKDRWADDWYVEPKESVGALFDNVRFSGWIHDPACGGGNIPYVARDYGYKSSGSDLVGRGFLGRSGVDFLKNSDPQDNIVTNPPYKLATEFALHALNVAQMKVAMLVRLPFLAGQKRREVLFSWHPPQLVLVLSKRPSMPPGGTDIPAKGGTTDYCWIVWDVTYNGPTLMRWILRDGDHGLDRRPQDPNGGA